MTFYINFQVDNAAFEDNTATETARILRSTAEKIEEGQLDGKTIDVNGNTIGHYGYTNSKRGK